MERFRVWLWAFGFYLSIASFITFGQFILEESFQTCMFGTWPASDVGDWGTVKVGLTIMKGINRTLKIVTYGAGWIQPIGFISYRAYAKSADFYIRGLTSKVLSNAPELFVGDEIELQFPVRSITRDKDGKSLVNFKRIFVTIDDTVTVGDVVTMKGVLQRIEGRLVLTSQ